MCLPDAHYWREVEVHDQERVVVAATAATRSHAGEPVRTAARRCLNHLCRS